MSAEKQNVYLLEVYPPEDVDEPLCMIQSSMPFGSIHQGDFIEPLPWLKQAPELKGLLEVLTVDHLIFESGNELHHKVMVYTKAVDKSRKVLLREAS